MDKYLYIFLLLGILSCTPDLENNKRLLIEGNIANSGDFDNITEVEVFLLNSLPSVDQDFNIQFQTDRFIGEKILGNSRLDGDGTFSFFSLVQDGGYYQVAFTQNDKLLKTGTINRVDHLLDLEEKLVDVEVPALSEVIVNFNASTDYDLPVNLTISYNSPSCNTNYDGNSFVGNSIVSFCAIRTLRVNPGTSDQSRIFASRGSTIGVSYQDANGIDQTFQLDVNSQNPTYDVQI